MLDLRLAIRGNLRIFFQQKSKVLAQAATAVIARKTRVIQRALRRQVVRAGLGQRLANALRSQVFPQRGVSVEPAGRVFSKAIYRRPEGFVDILGAFQQATVIRARQRRFLAIPARPGVRALRMIPRSRIAFIPFGTPRIVSRSDPTDVLFWLVPQVTLQKRLNFASAVQRNVRNTSVLIERDIERRTQRIVNRLLVK